MLSGCYQDVISCYQDDTGWMQTATQNYNLTNSGRPLETKLFSTHNPALLVSPLSPKNPALLKIAMWIIVCRIVYTVITLLLYSWGSGLQWMCVYSVQWTCMAGPSQKERLDVRSFPETCNVCKEMRQRHKTSGLDDWPVRCIRVNYNNFRGWNITLYYNFKIIWVIHKINKIIT